jgi:hypothetical protein
MQNYSNQYRAEIEIYISEYLAGPVLEKAKVKIFNEKNELLAEKLTDEFGYAKLRFSWNSSENPELPVRIRIEKEKFAFSEVHDLKITGRKSEFYDNGKVEIVVNKAKTYDNVSQFPEFSIKFVDLSDREIDLNDIKDQVIYAEITSTERITVAYFGVGFTPWAASSNGVLTNFDPDETVKIPIRIPHLKGNQKMNFVIYDINRNRLHKCFYININNELIKPEIMYTPENPWVYSVTRDYEARLYSLPIEVLNKVEFYEGENFNQSDILNSINLNSINNEDYFIPENGNIYVRIYWSFPKDTNKIIGYHVYKSFDGENFEKIAFTEKNSTADNGFGNQPGKRIWYKITSAYEGGFESDYSKIVSVVPLNMFKVTKINPKDNAYNVRRLPDFRWRPVSLKSFETDTGAGVIPEEDIYYYYNPVVSDAVQGDGGIWLFGSDKTTIHLKTKGPELVSLTFLASYWRGYGLEWVYRKDGKMFLYNTLFDALEPYKSYCWGLNSAYAEYRTNESISLAVTADIFKGNADLIVPNPSDTFNIFTTGENF